MNGIEFNSIDRFRQFKKEGKKEDRYEGRPKRCGIPKLADSDQFLELGKLTT